MRRIFLICLMVLLPFQFSWSAAAAACMHERSERPAHLGHHEVEQTDNASLDTKSRNSSTGFDYHHLPGVYPFPSPSQQPVLVDIASCAAVELSFDFPAITIAGIERPPKDLAELPRRDMYGYVTAS